MAARPVPVDPAGGDARRRRAGGPVDRAGARRRCRLDRQPLRFGQRVRAVAGAHGDRAALPRAAAVVAPAARAGRGARLAARRRGGRRRRGAGVRGRCEPAGADGARRRLHAGVRRRQRRDHPGGGGDRAAVPLRDRRLARAGARQCPRRGRCAAGAHPPALPVQQHEHHRQPGAPGPAARRARRARPVRPVPRGAGRRRPAVDAGGGSRAGRALPRDRRVAPRRTPAGGVATRGAAALVVADAPAGAAAAAGERGPPRHLAPARGRRGRDRAAPGRRHAGGRRAQPGPAPARAGPVRRRRRPRAGQRRPAAGLCLRQARADDRRLGRGLLSGRVPGAAGRGASR